MGSLGLRRSGAGGRREGNQPRRLCSLRGIKGAEGKSGKSGLRKSWSGVNSAKERSVVRCEKDQGVGLSCV